MSFYHYTLSAARAACCVRCAVVKAFTYLLS